MAKPDYTRAVDKVLFVQKFNNCLLFSTFIYVN